MSEELSDLLKIRREKLDELKKKGVNPFPYKYARTSKAREVLEKYKNVDEESKETVALAGRIMTKRGHGKASFANIQDETGRIQVYGKLDVLGEKKYEVYQKLDIIQHIGLHDALE